MKRALHLLIEMILELCYPDLKQNSLAPVVADRSTHRSGTLQVWYVVSATDRHKGPRILSLYYPPVYLSRRGVTEICRLPIYESEYAFVSSKREGLLTTNIRPSSFTVVHLSVCWSRLKGGLFAAEISSAIPAPGSVFSSINTLDIKLLIIEGSEFSV